MINKIIILFSFLFVFCSSQVKDEVFGDWLAVHIFIDGKEILENNYEETGWFPKQYRAKRFYILESFKQINLQLGWHDDKPIKAEFSNEPHKFQIFNSTDDRFNGTYTKSIKIDTVMQEGVRTVYYFLTLESKKNKILAVRNRALLFD